MPADRGRVDFEAPYPSVNVGNTGYQLQVLTAVPEGAGYILAVATWNGTGKFITDDARFSNPEGCAKFVNLAATNLNGALETEEQQQEWLAACQHIATFLPHAIVEQRKRNAAAKRKQRVANETKASEQQGDLPVIITSNRQLPDITTNALAALVAANDPPQVFVRGGTLVRQRLTEDKRPRPVIDTLDEHRLRGRMARTASYIRVDSRGEPCAVAPPMEAVRDLQALGVWGLPPLEAITESPTLRPDGSVLDTPGYDSATRLFYVPASDLHVPPISCTPSSADVEQALALVTEVIGDFPFKDQASYANALGALLTPIVRPTIEGPTPLGLFDAPRAGTGKGLLAEALTIIATGRNAAISSPTKDEEEWRKVVTTLMQEGTSVIIIDNVEQTLQSASLAAVLTAREWRSRLLGGNTNMQAPNRATWLATGNNMRLGGDMPRRCYWIRLDAHVARPWERTGFRHLPLLPWVRAHRGELLAALLVLARAWWATGQPAADVPPFGSFEDWTFTVGGILAYAGVEGFLANRAELYERAAEDDAAWEGFLQAWHDTYGEDSVKLAALAQNVKSEDPRFATLKDALPDNLAEALTTDRGEKRFALRLGKALRDRMDTVYGTLRVERGDNDSHDKVARWQVRGVQTSLPAGFQVQNAGFAGSAGNDPPRFSRAPDRAHARTHAHTHAPAHVRREILPALPALPASDDTPPASDPKPTNGTVEPVGPISQIDKRTALSTASVPPDCCPGCRKTLMGREVKWGRCASCREVA